MNSHMNYANLILGQNLHSLSRIIILQEKVSRIMNFQSRDSHSSLLFRSNNILRLEDKILKENILFISKSFNNLLPPVFRSWFTFRSDLHNYSVICHLKHSAQPKLKVYFLKNALENINEKVKGVFLIKQTNLL